MDETTFISWYPVKVALTIRLLLIKLKKNESDCGQLRNASLISGWPTFKSLSCLFIVVVVENLLLINITVSSTNRINTMIGLDKAPVLWA